jgi:hypothetical protein
MRHRRSLSLPRRAPALVGTGAAVAAAALLAATNGSVRPAAAALLTPEGASPTAVAAPSYAMRVAPLTLQSAGVMHFAPDGTLFLADSRAAAVYAIDVGDTHRDTSTSGVRIDDVDGKIAAALGTTRDQLRVVDMAAHPRSQTLYFSVTRGRGDDAVPLVVSVTKGDERVAVLPFESIRHARAELPDAPTPDAKTSWGAPKRAMSITDLALVDGELYVAGLSNEEFASTLRRLPYPFASTAAAPKATTVEIYHTSHDKYETAAPIETFVPVALAGKASLLAGYGCSPIAAFGRDDLTSKKHLRGRTISELGGGSRPIDMISFRKPDGREMILIASSGRTLIRMDPKDVAAAPELTKPVTQAFEASGVNYLSIASFGVLHIDNLNPAHVVVLQRTADTGALQVESRQTRWL